MLDIKGEHRRENIVHLVRAPSGPPAEPALHPSLDGTVRPHGPSPDGHTYHIDQILDHSDGEDGRLLVKVTRTGYEKATWEDASVASHDTLRLYLRRAGRRSLLYTAADPLPGVTGDNDAAAEAGTAPAPSVAAETGAPAGRDPPVGPLLYWARPEDGPRWGYEGRCASGATPRDRRATEAQRRAYRQWGGAPTASWRPSSRRADRQSGGAPTAPWRPLSQRRAYRQWGGAPTASWRPS